MTDYIGRPVLLTINTGPGYAFTFVGRVEKMAPCTTTHKGLINDSPFQTTEVVCMGRSYDMRGKKNASWSGYTLPDIATTMAQRYDLSLDVPATPLVYANTIQSNESDWQFLVRIANLHGYSVTCHGTHIHIFDPYEATGRLPSLHRLLSQKTLQGNSEAIPGVIIDFHPNLAERHPDGDYMDTSVTVLQEDGTTYTVTTSDLLGTPGARFTNQLADSADNYEEAKRLITTTNKGLYDYTADAQVVGLIGCLPGGVVNLDKYGGEFDGYWYVQEVEHHLISGLFTSDLCMARNKNSELVTKTATPKMAVPPAPRNQDGTLVTSRRVYNVY
jgi:hypothetical protein